MGKAKRRKKLDPIFGQSKPSATVTIFYDDVLSAHPPVTAGILIGNPKPFLETYGDALIGLARLGYEEKGRGMLVIPGVRIIPKFTSYVEMFYLTAVEVNSLPCLIQTAKDDCLRVIGSYDPDAEGAACFVFGDEYEIVRSGGLNPIEELVKLKQQLPKVNETPHFAFNHDDDIFIFTRGTPADWNERVLPTTRRITPSGG